MKVAVSWSGGKDSALACYYARDMGHDVSCLLNLVSREQDRCCFHGLPSSFLRDQAVAMGIPVMQKKMSEEMDRYEEEFNSALNELKDKGIEGMVFGDIYLDEHKEWVERVCGDCGMAALEPLWERDTEEIIRDFYDRGFRAVVVSCREEMGREFLGKVVNEALADDVKKLGLCPCGEKGEYHTFVLDGPLFGRSIDIIRSSAVLADGFWKHWSLVIEEYHLTDKIIGKP